ncbi:MAG TPA: hypothetical protein P5191_16765 [Ruminococcus sp.]|nr:hypothetical protein [Ruminococcus sp.]
MSKKIDNGYEMTPISPGWIKKKVPESYADDVLKDLVLFYVINTPCIDLSSSGLPLSHYGWSNDVWKKGKLKEALFKVAGLKPGSTFCVAHKTNEMKKACKSADLSKGFQKERNVERIAIYKSRYNEFLSICYHIRNAFAHGRLAMYDYDNGEDIIFVLEDGVKKNEGFQVRSRMILKKSTLKTWMNIIKSGKIPSKEQ